MISEPYTCILFYPLSDVYAVHFCIHGFTHIKIDHVCPAEAMTYVCIRSLAYASGLFLSIFVRGCASNTLGIQPFFNHSTVTRSGPLVIVSVGFSSYCSRMERVDRTFGTWRSDFIVVSAHCIFSTIAFLSSMNSRAGLLSFVGAATVCSHLRRL